MNKKSVIALCLLASSFAHALPNSATLRINGPGVQTVDLEKLVTRRISQSSTIQTLCNVTCYRSNMGSGDSRLPINCNQGQTYQVTCNQTIDTSYDVPDHTVSATVEVSLVPSVELSVDQDVTVTLGSASVSVSSRDQNIGFIVEVNSIHKDPRRGEPDFIHKVSLKPIDIKKLKNYLEPRKIQLAGSVMMFETGPKIEFGVKESMSVSRYSLFNSYNWSSYGREGFGFTSEPFAGGLLHKLDLAKVGIKMKKGKTFNFTLTRELDDKTPTITNFSGTDYQNFSFKPLTSF